MKVIIAGGRTFTDYPMLVKVCDNALSKQTEVEIVSGTANGADKLGERYAMEKGYPINRIAADWDGLGKSAGYKRNEDMAKYADALVVFWDGESKGTKHMIDLAYKYGLKVKIVNYG